MTTPARIKISGAKLREISDYLDASKLPIKEAMYAFGMGEMSYRTFRTRLHEWREKNGKPRYSWKEKKYRVQVKKPVIQKLPKSTLEPPWFRPFDDCAEAERDRGRCW